MASPIKIVALGDSLTEGMVSSSWDMFPYTEFLKEMAGSGIEFKNRGICGELTGQMMVRLKKDVLELKPDYMILLGGANDIGWGLAAEKILKNLMEMCLIAWQHNVRPVLCAIPPVEGSPAANEIRENINGELAAFCREENIPYIDLYTPLCGPGDEGLKAEYSDDGLHLSPEGYRKVAEIVYSDFIKSLVQGDS